MEARRRTWHIFATLCVLVVPAALLVVSSRVVHVALGGFLMDVAQSSVRLGIAYVISLALGWSTAVLCTRTRMGSVVLPLFDVLQSFPTFAALPLAVLAWGRSTTTVVVFLVITIVWPIFFSIVSSLKLVRRDWEEAARMARLRGWRHLRYFTIPASMPGVMTGTIIGLGEGWEALVATEIIVQTRDGLGPFFTAYATNPAVTTFGIVGLLTIIFALNKLAFLPLLERAHHATDE